MGSAVVGIVGVAVAATFWGSNFIVCKGYNLPDDGMHFVLLMATGILFVGLCTLFASQVESGDFEVVFAPDGLLGGAIWAFGNFLTVPIVKNIGLAMGLAIWAGVNLIVAFVVGAVGMGSILEAESLKEPALGGVGIVLAVIALVLFSRVKPTLDDSEEGEGELQEPLVDKDDDEEEGGSAGNIQLGIIMASIAGVCYGFQFVPLSVWNNRVADTGIFGHEKPSDTVQALRFFFSQFVGIFLTSLLGFVIYCIKTGNKPLLVPPEAVLPSICSGIVWAIGCAGGMFATSGLGNAVGFPLLLNLSFLVNSTWSIVYFREIQGSTNLKYFGGAFVMNVISSVLISLAKGS